MKLKGKSLISILLTLALVLSCMPVSIHADADGAWTKVSADQLASNDIVIVTMEKDGNYYALYNGNGTSSAPTAIAVDASEGVLTMPYDSDYELDDIKWKVSISEVNSMKQYVFYKNDSTWLYLSGNSNNSVRVGAGAAKAFTIDSESGYLKDITYSRYMGVYLTQDWRAYTTVNANIKDETLHFFKYEVTTTCDHEWGEWEVTTEATCTDPAQETRTCSKCGATETQDSGVALGHDWSEWSVKTTATCTAAAVEHRTCGRCDLEETRNVGEPKHNFVNGVCTVCGEPEVYKFYLADHVEPGDQIIFVNLNAKRAAGAIVTTSNSSYLSAVDAVITTEDDVTTAIAEDALVFTVVTGFYDDTYGFKSGNYYLSIPSDNNYVALTETEKSDSSSWMLTFDHDTGTVNMDNRNYSSRLLQYNSSSPRFSSYRSQQSPVSIFRLSREASLAGQSLSLSGDTGVDVIFQINPGNEYPQDEFSVTMSWGDGDDSGEASYALGALSSDEAGNFKLPASVAAKAMTDTITVKLFHNDTQVAEKLYSVKDYAMSMYNNVDGVLDNAFVGQGAASKRAALKELCRSMLVYGSSAQTYFNYNTGDLADKDLDDQTAAPLTDDEKSQLLAIPSFSACGLTYVGASLILESETTYRIYFSGTPEENMVITMAGKEVELKPYGSYWYVDFSGIDAVDLLNDIDLRICPSEDTAPVVSLYVGPSAYIRAVLEDDFSQQYEIDAVTAIYRYAKAANEYFWLIN